MSAFAVRAEAPRINGPSIYGVRPGSPIIYRVPATGTRPISYAAKGLPVGVTLDARKGILGGSTTLRGTNEITLVARNAEGVATKRFRLVTRRRGELPISICRTDRPIRRTGSGTATSSPR